MPNIQHKDHFFLLQAKYRDKYQVFYDRQQHLKKIFFIVREASL